MRTKTQNANLLRSLGLSTSLAMALSAALPVGAEPTSSFAKFGEDVKNAMTTSSLSVELPILNFDFLNGMNLEMSGKPKIDQSYIKNFFTQYRKGYFTVGGLAGNNSAFDWIKGALHFGAAPNYEVEVNFDRQFCTYREAAQDAADIEKLNIVPFFPLDSVRAQALLPGDYFSMKTKVGFTAGGSFLQTVMPHQLFDAGVHYFVSGSFQIHALRLPNQKMRIKIVSLGDRHFGATAGIGFTGALKVFKIRFIDKALTRVLDLSPVRINYDFKGKNNLLMAEYEVNLLNPQAHAIYDQMWNRSLSLTKEIAKNLLKLKIANSRERIEAAVLLDLEPLDEVARQDLGKSPEARRITRPFKATLQSDYTRPWSFQLGMGLIRVSQDNRNSYNKIVSIQEDGSSLTHYLGSSFKRRDDKILRLVWQRAQSDVIMNYVLQQDPNSRELFPQDFVFHVKKKQLKMNGMETQLMREQLKWIFPPAIYSQIDFSPLRQDLSSRRKTYQEYQVVLHPQVLAALPSLDEAQIAQSYQDYLDTLPNSMGFLYPESAAPKPDFLTERSGPGRSPGYYPKKFAKNLAIFLNKNILAIDRYKGLMELEDEPFFLKTGIGFILGLLPQDVPSLKELVHVRLTIDSQEGQTVTSSLGNQPVSAIYNRLLTIQNLVENGGLDLRLEGESLISKLDCHK